MLGAFPAAIVLSSIIVVETNSKIVRVRNLDSVIEETASIKCTSHLFVKNDFNQCK
jgi:hypothetical protein